MLTQEQENWLAQLNDNDVVQILPFDINCHKIFENVKQEIQTKLGKNLKVEHHGASSFEISGQNEIDVYIPVSAHDFDEIVFKVQSIIGAPRSLGKDKRARFRMDIGGKKIDLFVANEEHEEWKKHMEFKTYLLENSKALEEYKKLKENNAGKSTREYYRAKMEFINSILEQREIIKL
ncbi:MAG: GrpB family protein [Patescibacteria group bacterium]